MVRPEGLEPPTLWFEAYRFSLFPITSATFSFPQLSSVHAAFEIWASYLALSLALKFLSGGAPVYGETNDDK